MATKPAKAKFVIALTPPKKPRRLTKADTSPKLVCCICSPKASTFCILSYCSLPNINSNDSFVLGLSKPKDFFKAFISIIGIEGSTLAYFMENITCFTLMLFIFHKLRDSN